MANEKRLIDANATLAGIEAFMQCYAEKEKELTPFWIKVATQALDMVRQFIKEMPTVDAVEVVHGRWEYGKWEQGHWVKGNERCRCSVCHRDFAVDNLNIWHGCPQCLARMDGDGNEH